MLLKTILRPRLWLVALMLVAFSATTSAQNYLTAYYVACPNDPSDLRTIKQPLFCKFA